MTGCARAWEVEAARDGRLTGHEQQSALRHIALCSHCAREQERFEALACALRVLPVRPVDDLKVRRQRHTLLARALEDRQPARRVRRPWWRAVALVAALACALLVLSVSPNYIHRSTGARLAVMPDVDAQYKRWSDHNGHVVELKDGRLTFDVERFESGHGVLVRTPDGEIEDIGTVFSVTVREGRTEAISVIAGRVVARIAGKPARDISAGETLLPYAGDERVQPLVVDPVARSKTAAHVRRTREARPVRETVTPYTEAVSGDAAVAESEAARQFSLAVARVEARDNASALQLLERFALQFPADSRAEDAAYLRVVVLARGTDRGALRSAARAYLRVYPRGFRAPEVSRLLARDAGL